MTKPTTTRAIGNSAGTTIPEAMLKRYRLAEGDPEPETPLELTRVNSRGVSKGV